MTALRTVLVAVLDVLTPDATVTKLRARTSLDLIVTLAITALAVVLAVGYQALGRWARRSDRAA